MKFYITSEYGEILDLAIRLKDEGNEVVMNIPSSEQEKIGNGIIEKDKKWWNYMNNDWVFIFDGCSSGNLQDWLRKQGEYVFGGSELGDKLENDRQAGQKWFKKAGFVQPYSKNFTDIDECMAFVLAHKDKKWILKQNGDAPKSLNKMGKFDSSEDMIFHLKDLKGTWNEAQYGKFDCDLMEVVEGLEIAASAFFNGHDYLRNLDGEVVGYLNFEEKKETEGGMGETTGEMGTTFVSVTERNKIFKEILLKPEIIKVLKKINYRGVFDINCIKTDNGIVALEPTMRFGVPSTSYEFLEALTPSTGVLIDSIAKGIDEPISLKEGFGMVMVVAAKPFPLEGDIPEDMTSLGERLWILNGGEKTTTDFSEEQKKHIHLENFERVVDEETGEVCYKVATKNGYLLTVTGNGSDIKQVRKDLIEYIKDNIFIEGMKIRWDIGKRVEKEIIVKEAFNPEKERAKIKEDFDKQIVDLQSRHKEEIKKIKQAIKSAIVK